MKETIKKSLVGGIVFCLPILTLFIAYAATTYYTDLPQVSSGSVLSSSSWNNLVNYANKAVKQDSEVLTITGGNVGIGTTNPGEKLVVNGNTIINGSLSYNITRNIVTGNRSFWVPSDGTTSHIYQNTTNRTMFVSVSYVDYGDGGVRAVVGSTTNNVGTTIAEINHGDYKGSAVVGDTIDFIVLSGEYYKVYENSSGISLSYWIEYY